MTVIIKEIHVKTTVEKRAQEAGLSKETIAALKHSILREFSDAERKNRNKNRKDR